MAGIGFSTPNEMCQINAAQSQEELSHWTIEVVLMIKLLIKESIADITAQSKSDK